MINKTYVEINDMATGIVESCLLPIKYSAVLSCLVLEKNPK